MRRSSQFDPALKTCNDALAQNPDQPFADLLKFELKLIENKDADCHTMAESKTP